MTATAWQLDKHRARLRQERFSAELDLARPAQGLHRFTLTTTLLDDAHVLGVEIPSSASSASSDAGLVVEKVVRGATLAVAYRQTETWPIQVNVAWRALAPAERGRALAAVDLVVSVRTEHGIAAGDVTVRTRLAADEVLRLADAGASRFTPLAATCSSALTPGEGPGCLLFRRRGAPLSYAEMIHPADFHYDELTGSAGGAGPVQLGHKIFTQRVEKGVLLRARLRGVFCLGDEDAAVVAEAYRAFAAADPPLAD